MNYSSYADVRRGQLRLGPEDSGRRADTLLHVLRVILPYKRTIFTIGLLATAVGVAARMLSGPSYTASAIVQPEFHESPSHEKGAGMQPLDPSALLVSRVQLIRSQPLPAGIADHLFSEGSNATSPPGMVGTAVRWLLGSKPASPTEIALQQLKANLAVSYIPHSYLIQVSYTAPTREGSAAVANAVTGEFVRSERRKRVSEQVAAAADKLASLSATYGDRHPSIARARADLETVQTLLDQDTGAAAPMSEMELAATESVVPARANLALVDNRLRTILSGLAMGVLIGLVWAVFRERKRLRDLMLP